MAKQTAFSLSFFLRFLRVHFSGLFDFFVSIFPEQTYLSRKILPSFSVFFEKRDNPGQAKRKRNTIIINALPTAGTSPVPKRQSGKIILRIWLLQNYAIS